MSRLADIYRQPIGRKDASATGLIGLGILIGTAIGSVRPMWALGIGLFYMLLSLVLTCVVARQEAA